MSDLYVLIHPLALAYLHAYAAAHRSGEVPLGGAGGAPMAMYRAQAAWQAAGCPIWRMEALAGHAPGGVLQEVAAERARQDAGWGEQNHPNGTGRGHVDILLAQMAKEECDAAMRDGNTTYRLILAEEVQEAFAEADPAKRRAELIQVAAVAVAWVEKIDRDAARGVG